MSDSRHKIVPVVAATGLVIDMRTPHLGHPDKPQLWDELHGNCSVGTLHCQCCGHPLYLQERKTKRGLRRVACTYTEAQILEALGGESDEHVALKEAIARLAQRAGLAAEVESASKTRKRITDVVVTDGTRRVGWEIQLSPLSRGSLKRRLDRAVSDDLIPSWFTHSDSRAYVTLKDRAPLSMPIRWSSVVDFQGDPDVPVRALKTLERVPCTPLHRAQPWHAGKKCRGAHTQPAQGDDVRAMTLGGLVEKSITGEVVPFRWPRSTRAYRNGFWLWLRPNDVEMFHDLDGDRITPPVEDLPSDTRAWIGRDSYHDLPALIRASCPAHRAWPNSTWRCQVDGCPGAEIGQLKLPMRMERDA